MKVNIVARPDHSVALYNDLRSHHKCDVDLYTFYSFRKGSIANKLFPTRKSAPESARVLFIYTVLSYINLKIGRSFGYNWRKAEALLFDILAPLSNIKDCDVLHYWPFYSCNVARVAKKSGICTVAEYYEANPDFVNEIYKAEYEKVGLEYEEGLLVNEMINQNESFEFETDFIVASDFTKSSYSLAYPDKNYHICSYGPAGYSLACDYAEKLEKLNASNGVKKIVFVGSVSVEKGVHYLIDAVKGLNVELHLIGPLKKGQEHIFNISSAENVVYHGKKRHVEVLKMLGSFDFFCLPSMSDNYSLAVSEALSFSLPVIVTTNCGNKDDIEKYHLGLVAEAGSLDSLKGAIDKLLYEFDYELFKKGVEEFFSDRNQESYSLSVMDSYRKIWSSCNESNVSD